MKKLTSLLFLSLLSGQALGCANHFGTTVPHIYDHDSYLSAVENQVDEVKEMTLEEMLNGAAAPSLETERKNKFLEYYNKNVLAKRKTKEPT